MCGMQMHACLLIFAVFIFESFDVNKAIQDAKLPANKSNLNLISYFFF